MAAMMDSRFKYVEFYKLHLHDRASILNGRYPYDIEHLPSFEYLYPIKKDGRLPKRASRHMPHEKAEELYRKWQVQEVLGS